MSGAGRGGPTPSIRQRLRPVTGFLTVFVILLIVWELTKLLGGDRWRYDSVLGTGIAIVAARGGPHDGLVHEETAILYEEGDEDGFVSAVTRLLGDPDVGSRLGKNARAFAREHSSVSKMSIGYAAIYHELGGRDRTLSIGDFKG